MTLPLEPPKPIEDMTQEERKKWEKLTSEHKRSHEKDVWDKLEELRLILNKDQRIEAMAHLKKSSRFGVDCTYYLKAKALFMRDNAGEFLPLLEQILEELKELGLYDR